jgi:hypothetical protein
MAQSGQLKSRVTEEQLIGLLEQVSCAGVFMMSMLSDGQAEEAQGKSTKKSAIVVCPADLPDFTCIHLTGPLSFNVDEIRMMTTTSTFSTWVVSQSSDRAKVVTDCSDAHRRF